MRNPVSPRIPCIAAGTTAVLTGTALAHPGNHGVGEASQSWFHTFLHFFTHIDHVAPLIACVMILVVYRHRTTLLAFAKRHGFGHKPNDKP